MVERLVVENQKLAAENQRLVTENQTLRAEVAELKEKFGKNSSNSSKPPSSDTPANRPQRTREKSGRMQGAQRGHRKHERTLLPVEKARSVTEVRPVSCRRCGHRLRGKDAAPKRHQVVDVPPIEPVFDEWRLHTLACPACAHRTEAILPEGVPTLGYGPGVDAMVGQLAGELRLSKRTTAETMTHVLGVPMSVGAVMDAQNRVMEALAAPMQEAMVHAQAQPIKHADETPIWQKEARGYLWVCVTAMVTVFSIQLSRSGASARAFLGTAVGVLVTDRYSGYSWWPAASRQVCWAHLVRDFCALADRGGESARVGNGLLEEAKRMFGWWQRVREGTLSRATFRVYMRSVTKRVEALLLEGQTVDHPKTRGTCKKLWKHRVSLWTFVRREGVEPTNNHAERAIRFGVLWKRMSHGTMSREGSLFVARILTVRATLRQQGRNVHAYLRHVCQTHRNGQPQPSLLPTTIA